jgi:quinol monooxygenase YgiN
MEFVQIIEYETDRADEVRVLGEEYRAKRSLDGGPTRMTVCQDRDNPGRYLTVVEFTSYEAAMANSGRPETHEFAMRMAELCKGPPRFVNLDVILRDEFEDQTDAF